MSLSARLADGDTILGICAHTWDIKAGGGIGRSVELLLVLHHTRQQLLPGCWEESTLNTVHSGLEEEGTTNHIHIP